MLTSDERETLASTARRYLGGVAGTVTGISWPDVVSLGWTAIGVPEELGGAGYGERERVLLAALAGESLQGGALWPTLGLGLPLAVAVGRRDLAVSIVAGMRVSVAWGAYSSSTFSGAVRAPVVRFSDGRVTGRLLGVPAAAEAEAIMAPAVNSAGEVSVVLARAGAFTAQGTPAGYIDASCPVSVVDFDGPADGLATGDAARLAWRSGYRSALVWLAAESVGLSSFLLDLAVRHARDRQQFGRPIGSFQAVSHQLADLYGDVELAKSAVAWAAESVDLTADDVDAAVLSASLAADTAAVSAGEKAIQVFGGTGMTWESPIHRYLKRALVNESFDGNPRSRRRRLGDLLFDPAGLAR